MTNLRRHYGCQPGCVVYTSYIRINAKWYKVGKYYTKCKQFVAIPAKEETSATNRTLVQDQARSNTSDLVAKKTNAIEESLQSDQTQYPSQIFDKELLELCNSFGIS